MTNKDELFKDLLRLESILSPEEIGYDVVGIVSDARNYINSLTSEKERYRECLEAISSVLTDSTGYVEFYHPELRGEAKLCNLVDKHHLSNLIKEALDG